MSMRHVGNSVTFFGFYYSFILFVCVTSVPLNLDSRTASNTSSYCTSSKMEGRGEKNLPSFRCCYLQFHVGGKALNIKQKPKLLQRNAL